MKTHRLAIMLTALAVLSSLPVHAKTTHKSAAGTPKSDVVVTKNPDGTVEVNDAEQLPPSNSPTGKPGVTYHAAPPATIHYADGVVVHRNADGSVDVEDEKESSYHSFGAAPAATTTHHHHATTHSGTKSTAKSTSSAAKKGK